jgi:Spy/CpxP family protein refolding chaperone
MGPPLGLQGRIGWQRPGRGRFGQFGPTRGRGMGLRGEALRRGIGLGLVLRDPAARERIGISNEQAAKIQAQQNSFAQAQIRSRADLAARRLELRQLMAAETPDRAAVDKKMKELSDARLAVEKAQFEHQLAMRNALTPEQKQKLEEWRKERMEQFQPRGPMGPGWRAPRRGPGPTQENPAP